MKIIAPTTVTDAVLVSSTVPENDYPEWSSATAYTTGTCVIVAAEHKCYEALTGSTGQAPSTNPLAWLDLGATNRWRAFDQKVGTVTSAVGSITFVLSPGIVNGVALLNLMGVTSARIKMTDTAEGVVYDRTIDLYDPSNVIDWWSYFFEDIRLRSTSVVLDLPTYRTTQLEITLTGQASDTISIGACVVGKLHDYGRAVQQGASLGIQDYSRKDRDDFGNVQIVERAYSKRARWSFILPNHTIDVFQERMAALRATPAVYIGSGSYASTIVYGFFRDFDVVIAYPTHSECSIEIEGLV